MRTNCANPKRARTGSNTDKFIMNVKRNQILSEGKSIKIGDTELETVSEFKYLGCILKYDGSKRSNLLHRKHKAQNVFKALYRLWSQEEINFILQSNSYYTKLSLYQHLLMDVKHGFSISLNLQRSLLVVGIAEISI